MRPARAPKHEAFFAAACRLSVTRRARSERAERLGHAKTGRSNSLWLFVTIHMPVFRTI